MGGVGWVACQGFWLGKFVSVFWWVVLDFFSLEATNSRITEAEDRISEMEDRMVEINESERKKEK